MTMHRGSMASLAASLVVSFGCGHTTGLASRPANGEDAGALQSAQASEPMHLEGVAISRAAGPAVGRQIYDADTLFHLAGEAQRSGEREKAETLYQKLLNDFADTGLWASARFNLGLLREDQKRFDDAAQQYDQIVRRPLPQTGSDRRTWIDAHFRLAVCHGKLGAWWKVVATLDEVLEAVELSDYDKLEAMVGRGIAMQEADAAEEAEVAFSAALRFFREAAREGRLDDRGMVAEAAFRMGEIARDRFIGIALTFPIEVLRVRLERKCQELLSAQHRYLRAMRHGDAHTVAAAGFRIGALYESLYDAIIELETPVDLTSEQAEVYREEVRRRMAVLVKKALTVYERALLVGRRADTATTWVQRLESSIARLQGIYLAEADLQ